MAETSDAATATATATAAEAEPKTLTLVSSDGEHFTLPEEAAVQSITIKNIVEDGCSDGPIPLPNVDSKILAQVVVYLKSAASGAGAGAGEEILEKEKGMKKKKFMDLLFEYILAANYLNIKGLTDLVAQKIADAIQDKPPAAVRKIFGVKNDYTPEEEEMVKNEYQWVFDDLEDDTKDDSI